MSSVRSKGFTLLELLVAMGVLAILLTIVTGTLLQNLRNNRNMQLRYEAIQAAQGVIDDLRFDDITSFSADINRTIDIGDRSYAVNVKFCENEDFCISTEIRHVSVRVSYRDEQIYYTDTVFTQFL